MSWRSLSRTPLNHFLALVYPLGHTVAVPRQRSTCPGYDPACLTALYHQLQDIMPLLRDIVQPGTGEEGALLSAPGSSPSADADRRSRCAKRGKVSWAVRDSRKGDALLALTKEKKGAETLIQRLAASERSIAQLAAVHTTPRQAQPVKTRFPCSAVSDCPLATA